MRQTPVIVILLPFPPNSVTNSQPAHLRQRIRVQLRPLRDVTPRKEHARDLRVRPRHLAQLVLRLVAHHLDDLPLLVLRVR